MKEILTCLILSFFISNVFSQEDPIILDIRKNFKHWQPIIDKELATSDKLYYYAWGENFDFGKWYFQQQDVDSLTLSEVVSIIEQKDLGYFVYMDNYSYSGDWYTAVDYYFNTAGKLYFIFWRMNTFYAEEPLTVEKRLYFNGNQKLIKKLQSVYKMNTKEKTDISFMDQEVNFRTKIENMTFYEYWIKNRGN
ncbi:MAG: hypothetical protein MI922_17515 [Bacteroidales bacterium]|nr:hypothetical protein [Bacteroidales bacterium]